MASRKRSAAPAAAPEGINPKAPCPCGSGRRYKHCHGSGYAPPVTRRSRGCRRGRLGRAAGARLAATATAADDGRPRVTLASVLPGGAPALVRPTARSCSASRCRPRRTTSAATSARRWPPRWSHRPARPSSRARSAPPARPAAAAGAARPDGAVRGRRPRRLRLLAGGHRPGAAALAGLEHANEAILPTVRLAGLEAAYWVRPGNERAHLRWVRPEPEEKLLDALARLGARSRSCWARAPATPAPSGRSASSSRCGTCPPTPPRRTGSSPPTQFQTRLEQALAVDRAADLRRAPCARRVCCPGRSPCADSRLGRPRPRVSGRGVTAVHGRTAATVTRS